MNALFHTCVRRFLGTATLLAGMIGAWTLVPRSHGQESWIPFAPTVAEPAVPSPIDLRWLNEAFAGEHGWIQAKEGQFVRSADGQSIRFWAVNGPPEGLSTEELQSCARWLARMGVNLVRIHGPVFDKRGEVDPKKIASIHATVDALKKEGIYTHLSIYFPLWFTPPADLEWLPGYDGRQHPFAALMIHPGFQSKYREWLRSLLTTPNPATGKSLVEEPAVFGVEIQNEDSLFFWTFAEKNLPEPILSGFEIRFGDWLTERYGSADAVQKQWKGVSLPRDQFAQGRVAFRPLWNIANERRERDIDTARFLYESQSQFYQTHVDFVRSLGFRGLVHASNWTTASPERLGPLEKMSYTVGDFIDRHGYFECHHQGENAAWSIRNDHTYRDRSALRFEANEPGKPKLFTHPVMDPHYGDKPSMISETTFTRPNRYRSEAPLYFACYAALQDTDAIVHFALDGYRWNVKPRYFMQQWTLASPAMMGQFPAAALLYRQGLVKTGPIVADVHLNRDATLRLAGTPLPQDAALDELRAKDLPKDQRPTDAEGRIDPLLHFVGRTRVEFHEGPSRAEVIPRKDASSIVTSATDELALNYELGALRIDSPKAQGVSGALKALGPIALGDIAIESSMELGHILLVPLDGEPLSDSKSMLLQVMSEERASEFRTESMADGEQRIVNIGVDPWLFRGLSGQVRLARELEVTPLDHGGTPRGQPQATMQLDLRPDVVYYHLTAPRP